ncbi:MAG TPA: NAD kinase [Flavobacteriaceae bacterium]|nr:NAD kinase [Flavobacteriaceae bacterium]HIP26249.1 NAD kinase [Flavobacteriaceae bacterium]
MKIAVYGQYYKEEVSIYVEQLFHVLYNNNIEVVIEKEFYKFIQKQSKLPQTYSTFGNHQDIKNIDVLFTVGGDGTFLRSIAYVKNLNIPILGLNVGRLGFLANVQKEEIDKAIKALINKEYTIIERSLLQVKTIPEMEEFTKFNVALNEITIVRKNSTAMITVKTYLDDEFLTSYWADGLIIATPTGSTGYSLSCGGPVISPTSKNIILTPIAPHNLNARPLVIPDETKIKLKVIGREKHALLSLDSRIVTIPNNADVFIKKADYTIKTIQLHNQTFLKTLREKLLWGEDVRNF